MSINFCQLLSNMNGSLPGYNILVLQYIFLKSVVFVSLPNFSNCGEFKSNYELFSFYTPTFLCHPDALFF